MTANTEKQKQEDAKWYEMSRREKVQYLLHNITVEPMLATYIIPCIFAQLATQNLNLEKACRVNLRFSDKVCSALEARQTQNYTVEETQVQQLVASMSIWRTFLQSLLPALLIMFLGSWSDRNKTRKPFMLMPMVGEFITCVGLLLCVYFFYELPMEVAGFIDSFFPSVTGGWVTMFMAIFSYMGDITTVEMRTLRIGIVNVFCTMGVPFGTALSGVLLKAVGFYGVFSITAVLYVFSFTYGFIRIKEAKNIISTNDSSEMIEDTVTTKRKPGAMHFVKDFFDLQHIRETFSVAFKEGEGNRKRRVMLLMVVLMTVIGPVHGR